MIYHFHAILQIDGGNIHHMDGVIKGIGFTADPTTNKETYKQLKKDIGEFYSEDPEKIVICNLSVLQVEPDKEN